MLTQWLSKFFHIPPLQIQTLSIPPPKKSQKRQLQKFHTTYYEEAIYNYEPNGLFYNISDCS